VHFRDRADEEWNSTQKDNVIQAIADYFRASEGRNCAIFGISSKNLDEYITTEKDILKKYCKMPTTDFLID